MTFIQKYEIFEQDFGTQEIRFVVSDNFADLMSPDTAFDAYDGIEVDIFQLETFKQAFEGDGMSFAVDEMGFSVNEGICQTDDEKNALYFTLTATDVDTHIYCALFFNPDFTLNGEGEYENLLATRLFIGEITTDVGGEDLVIFGTEYSENKYPVREYKFKAASFDIALFDRLTFHEPILKDDGEFIEDGSGEPVGLNGVSGTHSTSFEARQTSGGSSDYPHKFYQNIDTLHSAIRDVLKRGGDSDK
jgi:hypothetical protein